MSVLYLDCADGVDEDLLLEALGDLGAAPDRPPSARAREQTDAAVERLAQLGHTVDEAQRDRLTAVFAALDQLAPAAVHTSPLPVPGGAHTDTIALRVLAGTGAELVPDPRARRLLSPLAAAILAVAADFRRPRMTVTAIARAEHDALALTAWLGDPVPEAGEIAVIETNIDDMPPTHLAALAEDALHAGALDVAITPTLMKKGRPGHVLALLARPEQTRELAHLVLAGSSTLGVRVSRAERILAGRRFVEVETPMGRVRVKVKELDGHAVDVTPEYDDCRRLGDVREVARLAAEAARRELGL